MKTQTSKAKLDLDQQLNRLVKKSVEGCTASSGSWARIVNTIRIDPAPAITPKEAKPALGLSK
jgi:hypothetical protein